MIELISLINVKKLFLIANGLLVNLKNRLKLHNTSKGAKFTRGRNWVLVYKKAYNSKSMAMKYEYKLKKNIKLRNELKKIFLEK